MKLDELAIATLGASLRPINPDLMKNGSTHAGEKRLWYQGNEPYFDVTIEKTADTITWFQVTLRGKVLSWRLPNYLQTGETDELDVPPDVSYYSASKTIRDGAQINWSLVSTIYEMLAQRSDDAVLLAVSEVLKPFMQQPSNP